MRKSLLLLVVIFFVFVTLFVTTPVVGQVSLSAPPAPTYTVQEGDTLWTLAAEKLRDPRVWTTLVRDNPFLQERGRTFVKGDKTVVLLRPGEKLVGLEELGLLPESLPISELQPPIPPVTVSVPWPTNVPVVVHETSGFPFWWLSPFVVLVLLAILAVLLRTFSMRKDRENALRSNPQDPVHQARGMRSPVLDVLGVPVTRREEANAANAALARVNETRLTHRQERLGGKLSEIIEVLISLSGEVLTQYRNSMLMSTPNGHRLVLGVFRDSRGLITYVSFNFRFCLNGMVFEEMPEVDVRTFASTVNFQNPKRVWNSEDYRRPMNMPEIQAWIRTNLASVASREAVTGTTVEPAVVQTVPAPVVPVPAVATAAPVVPVAPIVTVPGIVVPAGNEPSVTITVGGHEVTITGAVSLSTDADGNYTVSTQPAVPSQVSAIRRA